MKLCFCGQQSFFDMEGLFIAVDDMPYWFM